MMHFNATHYRTTDISKGLGKGVKGYWDPVRNRSGAFRLSSFDPNGLGLGCLSLVVSVEHMFEKPNQI